MRAITVKELIESLKTYAPTTLVGLSVDSEGNAFSLIPDEQFISECFMKNELGDNEYSEAETSNHMPTIILWPSN